MADPPEELDALRAELAATRELHDAAEAHVDRLRAALEELIEGVDEYWVTTVNGRAALADAKAALERPDERNNEWRRRLRLEASQEREARLRAALELGGICPWCDQRLDEHVPECDLAFMGTKERTDERNNE